MILFEWNAQKEALENVRTPVCFRILSSSLTSVSISSVCCYSIVSISVVGGLDGSNSILSVCLLTSCSLVRTPPGVEVSPPSLLNQIRLPPSQTYMFAIAIQNITFRICWVVLLCLGGLWRLHK